MPGGGSTPSTDLTTVMKHSGSAMLANVDPGTGTFADYAMIETVQGAMDAALSAGGGNPFSLIESYDSDNELSDVDTEYAEFDTLVDALSPSTDIAEAIAIAITEVTDPANMDLDPASSAQVAGMVTAMQDSSKIEMLKDVSRAYTGMYEIRAVMTTQMGMGVAQIEHQRTVTLADQEARLRMQTLGFKNEAILGLANAYLLEKQKEVEQNRLSTIMRADVARNRIVAEMDRISFDTEMESREAVWDIELFAHYGNMLASLVGAASMPRSLSPRERVLNAVMTSASTGIQAGQATGSVQGGFAFGVASLTANLWGQGIIGK